MNSTALLAVFIVNAVFGILALVFGLIGWLGLRSAAQARTWPTTTGRVLRAEAEARTDSEGSIMFYPVVLYEYGVNGQRYEGNRIGIGLEAGYAMRSIAERQLARYAPGGPVDVYYNPANPREARLDVSGSGARLFVIIAVVMVVVLALVDLGVLAAFFLTPNTPVVV